MKSLLTCCFSLVLALTLVGCSKNEAKPLPALDGRVIKSDDAPIDELMERSGLNAQIVDLPANVLTSAEDQLRRGATDVDDIRAILRREFNPGALRTQVRVSLSENLNKADIEHTLAWLSSDLGTKITALEIAGAADGTHADIMGQYNRLKENNARLAKIQQLQSATNATQYSVDLVIEVQRVLIDTLSPNMPESAQISAEDFAEKEAQARPRLQQRLGAMVEASYLYNYQSLTDEELQRYIDFASSDLGQRYHRALAQSLQASVIGASEKSKEAIVQL